MKPLKLKKKTFFSLITIFVCFILFCTLNSIFNINVTISNKIEELKGREIKFMYGEQNSLGDKYSENSSVYAYQQSKITYHTYGNIHNSKLITKINSKKQSNLLVKDKYINTDKSWIESYEDIEQYQSITSELKNLVEKDSYRDKKLGFYYVFDYDFTMDALKELSPVIEKTAVAQNTPKALITAVLFREMMFIGQEDLLDGLPFIGGKSIGICQIGLDNVRFNEQTVHGKNSVIMKESDTEIKEMLQNPNQAVYFCAVQLRARGINLSGDERINLNKLNKDQIMKVLEEYNQSKISMTIGPVKTKARYAEETYKYYELFQKYYELG